MQKVHLVECPRDAMQGWPHFISTEKKVAYINALLKAGFDTIDFGSFVSPKAIPQMADTISVLKQLDLKDAASKLLAIVANVSGAEEAVHYDSITYLGFPFSISPTFQLRNTNSTIEDSFKRVQHIQDLCLKHNKQLVIYLSMGFGNPYGDIYNEDILLHWADEMVQLGITTISLADTVGMATAAQIKFSLDTLIPKYPEVVFGVHLHSSPSNRFEKLKAAKEAGCLRFDGALMGIGGCPMAQDDLVGNMPTEFMIDYFEKNNLLKPFNKEVLQSALLMANKIFV